MNKEDKLIKRNLFEKILEIQKKIALVKKEDWTWSKAQLSYGGSAYEYRSFHTLMSKIAPFLREEKLILKFTYRCLPEEKSINIFQEEKEKFKIVGKEKFKVINKITSRAVAFVMRAIITDVSDLLALPYEISMIAAGEDSQDISKGIGKANTYAKRYLLLNLFAISDKEETVEDIAVVAKKSEPSPDDFLSPNDFKVVNL